MTEQTIPDVGAFTVQDQTISQANFDELYAAVKGGTGALTAGAISGTTGAFSGTLAAAAAATVGTTLGVTGLTTATGGLTIGTTKVPNGTTVTLAAGATNSINATITVKDAAGAAIAAIHNVEVFLSTSSTGALISATSYSGALTASTGAILTALAATKHIKAVTDVNGVLVLNLVASGKPATEYFCVVTPATGRLVVSAASGSSWGA